MWVWQLGQSMSMDLPTLLRRQHGVIATRQARMAGMSIEAIRWRVTDGQWTRIAPGIFYAYSGPMTWMARANALVLRLGEGGALTGDSAAYLHGVLTAPPAIISGAVTGRQVRRLTGTRVVRRRAMEVVHRRGLPVTSAATTVLDSCAEYSPSQWREIVHLLARWVHSPAVTAHQVLDALGRRGRYAHRALIMTALEPIIVGVESVLEYEAITGVVLAHGLPKPTLQARAGGPGELLRRDAEWTEFGVILECDGVLFHTGASAQDDRRRDRRAARAGRVTLRAGHVEIVYGRCELAVDLFLTLRSRGFRGALRPCGPRCPARVPGVA